MRHEIQCGPLDFGVENSPDLNCTGGKTERERERVHWAGLAGSLIMISILILWLAPTLCFRISCFLFLFFFG